MTQLSKILYDAQIELGIDLERVSTSARGDVLRLLKDLEKELVAKVSEGITDWQKARISKLLSETKVAIQSAYDKAAEIGIDTTSMAAQVSATATAQSLTLSTGGQIAGVLPTANYLETVAGNAIIQGAVQSDWWSRQSMDTAWRFNSAVRQGLVGGETTPQIVRRVRDVMDVSKRNAEALVRTSVQTVASQAREKTFQQNDDVIAGKEWVATLDARVCPECGARDGKRWGVDEKPKGNHSIPYQAPPLHFNCLPADALITSESVTGMSKRWMDGNLVIIKTASGRKLSCTPNHPILTDGGWLAANLLAVGNYVVANGGSEWTGIGDGNNKNIPTAIHKVTEAFLSSRKVSAAPVPMSAEDFHGDGADSKVGIVCTDSLLSNEIYTSTCEHCGESFFVPREFASQSLLHADSSQFFSSLASFASHDGIMGGTSKQAPFFGGHPRGSSELLLAGITHSNTGIFESPDKNSSRDSELISNSGDSYSAVIDRNSMLDVNRYEPSGSVYPGFVQSPNDAVFADIQAMRDLLGGFTGEIFFDYVVSVEIEDFHGFVFNIETNEGWYTANGIITHNCRCAMVPVLKSFKELGIDLEELPPSTRASVEGQVSDKTFGDWLKRQPVDKIEEVLGKGRADLFKRGVISFNDLVDGRGSPLTLEQIKKKYL